MGNANVEIKARVDDLNTVRDTAGRLGAAYQWRAAQVDTYFHSPSGWRLKLRETNGQSVELVRYSRADEADPRTSRYEVTTVADVEAIRSELTRTHGTRIVVRKVRELWLLGDIRIHLDDVERVGTFVEVEAPLAPGTDQKAVCIQTADLAARLGLERGRYVAQSYSDLAVGL